MHAAKYLKDRNLTVCFLSAKENGRDAWFVLRVDPLKYLELKNGLSSGKGNIRDFGKILNSGWGKLDAGSQARLEKAYMGRE